MMKKKYEQCYEYILNYIKHNQLSEGQKLPTEDQLIELTNFSRITVRRAVSELEEKGIIYKVRGSGTFVAENMENTSSYIPLIFPASLESEQLFYQVTQGLNAYFSKYSCYLTLFFSDNTSHSEENIINQLLTDGIHQMIIFLEDNTNNSILFSKLEQKGARPIFLDRLPANFSGDLIQCDNIKGGHMAASHLISQGYRRIAFLFFSNKPIASCFVQRAIGYKNALIENNLPIREEYIIFYSGEQNEAFHCVKKLMELPEPPDAIFCANDYMAVDTFKFLQKLSYSVPDDIALIGFDDDSVLDTVPIGISTISQSFYDLGYEAARTASEILGGHAPYKIQKLLPVKLIIRDSTTK